jgi:arsenical pump membrane protein
MIYSIVIASTLILMMLSLKWFSHWRVGQVRGQTYWVIVLLGALMIWALVGFDVAFLLDAWTGSSEMNPLRILGLFFSFTLMAIYLDDIGYIRYLAYLAMNQAGHSQRRLFFIWFVIVSISTMLTANDIVILTLTPFMIYFAKHTGISPIPFLVSQFVAANTWSMMLVIGNPTNIYLASMFNISFLDYATVMFLPTLLTGVVSYGLLVLIFQSALNKPVNPVKLDIQLPHPSYRIGITILGVAILMMALAKPLGVSMDIVTLVAASLLVILVTVKYPKTPLMARTIRRLPYSFIAFFLGMAILVKAMGLADWTQTVATLFQSASPTFSFGVSSFLMANVINNIPMSLWFESLIRLQPQFQLQAVYASIIGSNLGAMMTPVGALAGLMWMNVLQTKQVSYGIGQFLKFGLIFGPILLLVSLLMLDVILR